MSRRIVVLAAVALILVAMWIEFSVASPWHGRIRATYENYQLHRLRSSWRPPCQSAGWSHVALQGIVVPVPDCLEFELQPSLVDGAGPSLIAYDRNAADTHLIISVERVPEDRTGNIRAAAQRLSCSIINHDGSVFMWQCFDNINVLVSDRWLSASLYTPPYLTPETREREAGILIDVANEFARLQTVGDEPANNALKQTVTPLAAASVAPAAYGKRYVDRKKQSSAIV